MNKVIAKKTAKLFGIASEALGIAGGVPGGLVRADATAVSVSQHSSNVLSSVIVKPVFWGSQWFHPSTPSAGQINWANPRRRNDRKREQMLDKCTMPNLKSPLNGEKTPVRSAAQYFNT
jgi:hypothetical protein